MSPRDDVTAPRLREFLAELGRAFAHPARLYLSGGEGLVLRGLRGATADIDVSYDVEPAHHDAWFRALRDLKERLRTSVEEAGPADFIPLPPGAADRAEFVGRFGRVDVFLFDPYSVALSKIERGHAQDLADVRAMLAAAVIQAAKLRELFEAILPRYEASGVKADPVRFRQTLDDVLAG